MLAQGAVDDEHLAILRDLGLRSYMCVPLLAHGRSLGAITFIAGESGIVYGAEDLALAKDLARHAALAVDNARHYRAAEERGNAARVLSYVGDGVFLLDRRGVIRLWNPAAEAITGLPREAVIDRLAEDAIPGWTAIRDRVPVSSAPGQPAGRPETTPLDVGEQELWLSISGVAFADGTVYAFRDLTEERRLEELRSEFVATASHELRTPLAAVYGAAMTLKRHDVELGDDRRERLLDVISDESDRLARIVNDILWASRLDSGRVDVSLESVDPAVCALRSIEAHRAHLPASIRIDLLASDHLPSMLADPDKVRQVLTNLIDNAVKFSLDGGTIEVRVEPHEHSVRFSVRDEGIGMPPHEQRRIFEKFYRLDPNLTRGVGGTGLGLYICRELVKRMDGRIWVASKQGQGSTFFFELPAARQPPEAASKA